MWRVKIIAVRGPGFKAKLLSALTVASDDDEVHGRFSLAGGVWLQRKAEVERIKGEVNPCSVRRCSGRQSFGRTDTGAPDAKDRLRIELGVAVGENVRDQRVESRLPYPEMNVSRAHG